MEDFATFCKNQPSLLSRIWTSFKTKPKALNKRDNLTKLENIVKQELQTTIDNKVVENNFRGTLFEPFANKDNFWNFIFALGMILGSITIGFVFSLIIMVLILKRFSKITFLDGKVFNSQGKELSLEKQTPSAVFVILTTVASTVWISMHFSAYLNALPSTVSAAIIISSLVFIPTLFFILKNCPISILFNYDFYKLHAQNAPMPTRRRNEESTSTSSHYWYLPNNIYNPHHRK
jgi:hypothetical protein